MLFLSKVDSHCNLILYAIFKIYVNVGINLSKRMNIFIYVIINIYIKFNINNKCVNVDRHVIESIIYKITYTLNYGVVF